MHHRVFCQKTEEEVHVNFNSDFSGNAIVYYKGKTFEVPAIILTIGISDLSDNIWNLWEFVESFKKRPGEDYDERS